MSENVYIEHTTEGIVTRCSKCGEEIMSINHKCNPFIAEKNFWEKHK